MRIASSVGRLVVARDDRWFDVEKASDGAFSHDPQAVYERWGAFAAWASDYRNNLGEDAVVDIDGSTFDAPVPHPRQIFAIGLNYREHAKESNFAEPDHPVVFTKFQTSLTGHGSIVRLPSDGIDWEVELGRVSNVGRGPGLMLGI